jgi:hypothetical protein
LTSRPNSSGNATSTAHPALTDVMAGHPGVIAERCDLSVSDLDHGVGE